MHRKSCFLIVNILLCLALLPIKAFAIEAPPGIHAKHAILANVETGLILYEEGARERTAPGYLNMIMTALLTLENVPNPDITITISDSVNIDIKGVKNATTASLKAGEVISVSDLIYTLFTKNACDAANALAEHIAGSKEEFVKMMNSKAQEIGCKDTKFTNTHGLDDPDQYTTAYDMYLILKTAINRQGFMDYAHTQLKRITKTNMTDDRYYYTSNYMILSSPDRIVSDYYLKYARGVISSYTVESGYSVATVIKTDNIRYICIVMGATRDETTKTRYNYVDAKALANWALNNYQNINVLKRNEPVAEVPVLLSSVADSVVLVAEEDYSTLLPKDIDVTKLEKEIITDKKVKAPIKKGDRIGEVVFKYNGQEYGRTYLVAQSNVNMSVLLFFMDQITTFLKSKTLRLIILALIALIIFYLIIVYISKQRRIRRKYPRRKRYR